MIEFTLMDLLLFIGMLCFANGQTIYISAEFLNGRLIFKWTNVSTICNEIIITKDSQSSDWIRVDDDQYTVEDVMQYNSVTIMVREFNNKDLNKGYQDYRKTYNVSTVESNLGESRNMSWTIEYFPQTGIYFIFHEYNGSVSRIIRITYNYIVATLRHVYHSRPLNSTNILIEVKNITVEDAGYYVGSPTQAYPMSGEGGVVLIVSGKPMKPIIRGKLNVKVGDNASLKCESKSTSAPYYYKKFPPLLYSWFVNNTKLNREVRETYSFNVTKDVKYNQYSCRAKETLESDKSEDIRMNPLYGPERITLIPQLPDEGLDVHEGKTFGPYNCSADCNPPCTVQWKYKSPLGEYRNASSVGLSSTLLPQQTASRANMTLIRCIVTGSEGRLLSNIKLNVQYLLDSRVYMNGKPKNALTINETNPVHLSCFVDGNPTPEVTLRKLTGNRPLMQIVNHWLNYTLNMAQCSDTGTFECVGKSTEFGRRNQSFSVNVLCEPRLDEFTLVKNIYGSKSGPDVKVVVSLPVVANPLTSTSGFVWLGPTFESISIKVSQRDNVFYKHWINSTIPVPDRRSFGTYSLKYKGKVFADITIHAEGVNTGVSTDYREASARTTWIIVGVIIGLSVLLLTNFGIYKFASQRGIKTDSIQPPQPSHDLKITNKEYDDVDDVTVEAQDQNPSSPTYEDVTENTEQIQSPTDYQNVSGHQDNQYQELKPDQNRLYSSLKVH